MKHLVFSKEGSGEAKCFLVPILRTGTPQPLLRNPKYFYSYYYSHLCMLQTLKQNNKMVTV